MSTYTPLPLSGIEPPLSEMDRAIQENIHRFAVEVMRPLAPVLDKMDAEAMPGKDSPLWDAMGKASELGLSVTALAELQPLERVKLFAIASEELGWGDGGLAGAILVNHFPAIYSLFAGNLAMVHYCEGKLGCWGITEPDHGSDMLDATAALQAPGGNYGLTKEYLMENLFRDARALLIADGANEVLAMKGGSDLINPDLH